MASEHTTVVTSLSHLSVSTTATPPPTTPPTVGSTVASIFLGPIKKLIGRVPAPIQVAALSDVSLTLKRGEVTLVVGGQGSGRTLLLRSIAGHFSPHSDSSDEKQKKRQKKKNGGLEVSGVITTNLSTKASSTSACPLSLYLSSLDQHEPALTVKETLTVAADLAGPEKAYPLPGIKSTSTTSERVDALISFLGLSAVSSSRVGSLSHPQTRALTLGEALLTGPKLLAFYEIPTTALDEIDPTSAGAVFSTALRAAADAGATVVASVREPPPRLLAAAHNIVLLSQGLVLYAGPVAGVSTWMSESLQLTIPSSTSVGEACAALVADPEGTTLAWGMGGGKGTMSRSATELAAVWAASARGKAVVAEAHVAATASTSGAPTAAASSTPAPITAPFSKQYSTLLSSRARIVLRSPPLLLAKVIAGILISFLLGALLYNPSVLNSAPRGSVILLFAMSACSFGILEIRSLVISRDASAKRVGLGLHGHFAQALSTLTLTIPSALIASFPVALMLYFFVNFAHDAGRFFFFCLVAWAVYCYPSGWSALTTSIAKDAQGATGLYTLCLLFSLTSSGMLLAYTRLPPHFRFVAFWLNPASWTVRSMVVSETNDESYDFMLQVGMRSINGTMTPVYAPTRYGSAFAAGFDLDTSSEMMWAGPFYLFGCCIAGILFSAFLRSRKGIAPPPPGTVRKTTRTAVSGDGASAVVRVNPATAEVAEGNEVVAVSSSVSAPPSPFSPSIPVTLTWTSLTYTQPTPRKAKQAPLPLLDSAHGLALPGSITALVSFDLPEPDDNEDDKEKVENNESAEGLREEMAQAEAGPVADAGFRKNALPATATSGTARSGSLVLSSRALLTLLASRPVKGTCSSASTITYNSQTATPALAASAVCIAYSDDVHNGLETVKEALEASVFLRGRAGDVVSSSSRAALVASALEAAELVELSNRLVSKLSPSEFSRLRIAVELVTRPSVLLVEEPLHANDIAGSRATLRLLDRAADAGITVLVSLQSPSAEFSGVADSVVLMSGATTLFTGPMGGADASPALAAAGVVAAKSKAGIAASTNPLARASAAFLAAGGNALTVRAIDEDPSGKSSSSSQQPALALIEPQTAPRRTFLQQWRYMQFRAVRDSWRNIPLNFGRQIIFIIMGLFVGLLFVNIDDKDFRGSNAKSAIVFFLCTTGAITTFSSIGAYQIGSLRPSIYRERAAMAYHSEAFSFSQIADLPWIMISSLCFNVIPYASAGLDWSIFGFHYFAHILLCVSFGFMGHLLAAAAPVLPAFGGLNMLFITFNVLLAGTFVSVAQMPEYMAWINKAVPISWAGKILILNAMHCEGAAYTPVGWPASVELRQGCVNFVTSILPGVFPRPWDRYEFFAFRWQATFEDRWVYAGYLGIFIAVYRVVTILAAKKHWGKEKV